MTTKDQATFEVGDTSYGFRSTVNWTDSAGGFHDHGWPECLPRIQAVTGVRFAGTVIRAGGIGVSSVVWVDCQHICQCGRLGAPIAPPSEPWNRPRRRFTRALHPMVERLTTD